MENLKKFEEMNFDFLKSRKRIKREIEEKDRISAEEAEKERVKKEKRDQETENWRKYSDEQLEKIKTKYNKYLVGTPYKIWSYWPADEEQGATINLDGDNKDIDFTILDHNPVLLLVDCGDYSEFDDKPGFVRRRYIEMPNVETAFEWIKDNWYTAWRAKDDGTEQIKVKEYGKKYMYEYVGKSKDPMDRKPESYSKIPPKKRAIR